MAGGAGGGGPLNPLANARTGRIMAAMSDVHPPPARMILRIVFGGDAMLGPGKADLLQGIRDTGSISAAGRRMAMSYKRAWTLVEEMNAAFRDPLVDSARGGAGGGGARLTPAGETVLCLYREIEDSAARAGMAQIEMLRSMLSDVSGQK